MVASIPAPSPTDTMNAFAVITAAAIRLLPVFTAVRLVVAVVVVAVARISVLELQHFSRRVRCHMAACTSSQFSGS